MSASESSRRGGQPSTTTPTPPPCDSPHVVMRNKCPNEFAIAAFCGKNEGRSNRPGRIQPASGKVIRTSNDKLPMTNYHSHRGVKRGLQPRFFADFGD